MRRWTPVELATIYERVAGPRLGLFLPINPQVRPTTGAEVIVPLTYADITGGASSAGHLYDDLHAADSIETIYRLAGLNILLESRPDFGVEQAAVDHYVRPEFSPRPPSDPSTPQPTYSFIFNRVGVLVALKGMLGAGGPSAALGPTSEHHVGDLILRANEFISDKRFQARTSAPTDLEFAAEFIPTWDLTNTRDLAYGMARMYRMLEHLGGADPQVVALKSALGIVSSDLRFGGLLLNEFLAAAFGLYSYARNIPADVLLRNSSAIAVDIDQFLAEVRFPRLLLERFFVKTSLPLADLRDRLTGGGPWTRDRYADLMSSSEFITDFVALREHPLLSVEAGRYIVLDLQFLAELLSSGLFFDLLFTFPRNLREDFLSLWGRIFELSLFELLQHFYPPSARILQTDIPFEGGQLDALLDFGDFILVFEFKHFLLPHNVKYARDATLLGKELKKKLFSNQKGKQKAIRQLASATEAIRTGRIATLLGRTESRPKKAAVYPVVVVADASLEAPLVNAFVNELFQGQIAGLDVKPLTLMSVEELEETLPIIATGPVTWNELFDSRFENKRVSPFSVGQARYELARSKGIPYVRNQFRLDQFAAVFAHIRKMYEGRVESGSAGAPS
ncbi:MAG TPA: hypothetical protein VGR73_03280 [Bryobacteraceae bacterium]|nr:hypothetical protein [Bryobacteraceae bacterium]